MKIAHDTSKHGYMNVMEILVAEEVEKQIKTMQPRMLKYLKRVEVETFALNRLPARYASSEKGWQHQYEKAKREQHSQIKSAVRQAFAAVQVDPIRSSEPLRRPEDAAASTALNALRDILKQPDLSWDGAINRLQTVLGLRAPTPTASVPEGSHRTRYRDTNVSAMTSAEKADSGHSHYWRPGTYGSEVSWQKNHNSSGEEYDWNDPRYIK